jgi:uncharacterized protein YacL (UPF0231 family)
MKLISFYRDDSNMLRAKTADKAQLLATFLETDIQEDKALATELLKQVDAVNSGKKKRYETSGNAHAVTMTPKTMKIESLFDDEMPPYRLKLTLFKKVLTQWIDKM